MDLKAIISIVALIVPLIALCWQSADRRRQLNKEQLSILQPILDKPLKEQHGLVLEMAFRACFGETVSATEFRCLFGNRFSLKDILSYCKVRWLLSWDDSSESFQFRTLLKPAWLRLSLFIVAILLYITCVGSAVFLIDIIKSVYHIVVIKFTVTDVIVIILLETLLICASYIFLFIVAGLYKADRFMKRLSELIIPRIS